MCPSLYASVIRLWSWISEKSASCYSWRQEILRHTCDAFEGRQRNANHATSWNFYLVLHSSGTKWPLKPTSLTSARKGCSSLRLCWTHLAPSRVDSGSQKHLRCTERFAETLKKFWFISFFEFFHWQPLIIISAHDSVHTGNYNALRLDSFYALTRLQHQNQFYIRK